MILEIGKELLTADVLDVFARADDRPAKSFVFPCGGKEKIADPFLGTFFRHGLLLQQHFAFALYFSRHPIPFPRNPRTQPVKKHIGLYAYRRDALLAFAGWSPTPLETAESLEQLRFMENGVRIFMAFAAGTELAVDTPEQAEQVRRILAQRAVASR